MRRLQIYPCPAAVFLLAGLVILLAGCPPRPKGREKPPPETTLEKSFTVRTAGYKQTVTVKAPPEQLVQFMGDIASWFKMSGMKAQVPSPAAATLQVGDSFPFDMEKMGVKVSGRMILVRVTDTELGVVWDNPLMFHVQRWRFEKAAEGTRVTLEVATEVPEDMVGTAMEELGIIQSVNKEIDFMLASIQAQYDKSVKPEQLVALGLRGESYEGLLQGSGLEGYINAPPEEVEQYIFGQMMGGEGLLAQLSSDPAASQRIAQAAPGEVVYAAGKYQSGLLKADIGLFFMKRAGAQPRLARLYITFREEVAYMDIMISPKESGSLLDLKLITEIPAGMSPEAMDILVQVSQVPKLLKEQFYLIKQALEKPRSK